MKIMKRASYRFGVEWVALNDETGETDRTSIQELVSVLLLADLFGVPPERVAGDVLKYRSKHESK